MIEQKRNINRITNELMLHAGILYSAPLLLRIIISITKMQCVAVINVYRC